MPIDKVADGNRQRYRWASVNRIYLFNQGKRIIKTFSPHAVFCSRESRESREKRIVSLAFAFRTATYERQQCMFSRDSRDSREIFIFNWEKKQGRSFEKNYNAYSLIEEVHSIYRCPSVTLPITISNLADRLQQRCRCPSANPTPLYNIEHRPLPSWRHDGLLARQSSRNLDSANANPFMNFCNLISDNFRP